MKKASHMRRKYFFRKLRLHLLVTTFPILAIGVTTTLISKQKLSAELSSYADKSKTYLLNILTDELSIFDDDIALFSNSPALDRSVYKLMNKQALSYKDNVYKSIIPTMLSTSANVNTIVDSVYVYYDNPNGNYFSSVFGYTNTASNQATDTEWLSMYTSSSKHSWFTSRIIKHYACESSREVLSYFYRLSNPGGVIVINYLADALANIIDINQIYGDSVTLLADSDQNILISNPGTYTYLLSADGQIPASIRDLISDSTQPYHVLDLMNEKYIVYTSPISKYKLSMIFLVPQRNVFQTVNTMVTCFSLIIGLSIVLSISMSIVETTHNFRQLSHLLELFSESEAGTDLAGITKSKPRNEYDLIFNNIIHTFMLNNNLKLNLINSKLHEKDAQIAALQLQLNPHFIFNTLQAVDLEILKTSPFSQNASMLIHHLSSILEYSLRNSFNEVTVKQEIEICKTYAKIQTFRYSNPFLLFWEYEEDILEEQIIHLILQPLIENCLHHGIKELPRKGLIKVKIRNWKGLLQFVIIDNGVGISRQNLAEIRRQLDSSTFQQASHIGLYNTNLRLKLTYGELAKISIASKEGMGTITSFSIPLTQKPGQETKLIK